MTLKDYINKEQLTAEEQKKLIDELYKDTEEFLSDCYIDELPPFILNIIEENGLKNGDIAYSISQKWKEFESIDGKTKEDWGEKENYWFLKAVELGSNSISLKDYMFEDSDGEPDFDYLEMDYDTPLIEKAKADCYNSWGCRYALGLDDEEVNYKYAYELFKLSESNDAKISLYYIFSNGLGVKKNLKKANAFIKHISTNTPLYAFKSNISEGIKIEKIEEDNNQEKPKKEKKQRKPRKKNKVKSFFKKILSLFK